MRVRSVKIEDLRAIKHASVNLGPVTLLVGPNNSGKSTIIRAIHSIQEGGSLDSSDTRFGSTGPARAEIVLNDIDTRLWADWPMPSAVARVDSGMAGRMERIGDHGSRQDTVSVFSNLEPDNFIYPYLADRKAAAFEESINDQMARQVRQNYSNLAAKVDRLMDAYHPAHNRFRDVLADVVGLPLSAIASAGGKQVGMWVDRTRWIPLQRMGSGIAQMLGLIVHLCVAESKLFLIEELENDIHPKGLKALLRLIEERSSVNQFVVSTHSNIVVRHLGSLSGTQIYQTALEVDSDTFAPIAHVRQVGNDVRSRTALLSSLGYELSDMDLYDGWLVLEESSAERIIRDYLIPWFAPELSRVRTVASQGTSDLDPTFEALDKLVLYMNLQKRYEGRVRVIADGDPSGVDAIEKLRVRYSTSWPRNAFRTFTRPDFEQYYPLRWQKKVLDLNGLEKRRSGKQRECYCGTYLSGSK